MSSLPQMHTFVISLGSNTEGEYYISKALSSLRGRVLIEGESPIEQTEAVDFPYSTHHFTNVIIIGRTYYSREELVVFLHQLEQESGRDRSKKEQVTLDADLVIWDNQVLKPKDIERPYFQKLHQKACRNQI